MENLNSSQQAYKLSFHGKGSEYFGVIIINWLLTMLTLGIYYPWAKARQLKFMYGSAALNEDRFAFHGTGNEMFKGFIKTLLIFGFLFGVFYALIFMKMLIPGLVFFYLGIFAITPLAIHGSYRYRMSRTSWRGIRFGYRGEKTELVKNFFLWLFYTIITLGIYGAWFTVNIRNYTLSNIRFGNIEFKSKANGLDYFLLNIKGYFLTIFTLGIYMFWWQKDLFNFYIDNISLEKEDQQIQLKSTATGGDFFKLMLVNLLIIIFTLGLGYAWVATRTMSFVMSKINLDGNLNLDAIIQTEENYKNAMGEDMNDFLNIDFII